MVSMYSVPFFITVFRLIAALLVLPPLFCWLSWQASYFQAIFLAVFVALVALTDFLDGYWARRFGGASDIGRLLDPIADKVFVAALFLFLLVAGRVDLFVVLIFVAREYVVTGFREAAERAGFTIHVSWVAKAKTFAQMSLGIFLIVNPIYYGYSAYYGWLVVESIMVWATVGLVLFSGLDYGKKFMEQRGCPLEKRQG